MSEFGYPLARASRWRVPTGLPRYVGSIVVGLAIALVAVGLESTLDISRPGVGDALASPGAGDGSRHPLPIDRVLTVSEEILGRPQAADIWSTPLRAGLEPDVSPQLLLTGVANGDKASLPADLFGPVSLIDGRPATAAVPAAAAAAPPSPPAGPVPYGAPSEARPVAAAVLVEPAPAGAAPPRSVTTAALSPELEPEEAAPRPSARAPAPTLRLAGRWAATRSACSARGNELLPLVIGGKGARAGDASCAFNSVRQQGSRWSVAASCRNGRETWRANIRLTMVGNRLTWSSERGTQAYIRCS